MAIGFLTMQLKMLIIIAAVCLSTAPAWGAGLWLYEGGQPDVGTAAAGRAALANDASTAAINPAGMTRLVRSQVLMGIQPLLVRAKFDADSGTTTAGSNGGDAGDWVTAGSASYVHSVSDDFKIGFTMGSYFGLGLDYDDDWVGRYYVTEGAFTTYGASLSTAYRINN
jgi:long-chain fatty acid transport protein